LAGVVKEGLLGFVDANGTVVIPFTFEYGFGSPPDSLISMYEDVIPFFSEGLAAIWGGQTHDNLYGYIDREGHVCIPFAYDYAASFSEGLAYVSEGGSLIDSGFFDSQVFSGKYGFIDKMGQLAIPMIYNCHYRMPNGLIVEVNFHDGFASVSKLIGDPGDYKFGMIDKTGTVIVPMRYGWIFPFHDGVAHVALAYEEVSFEEWWTWEGCGLVDNTGKELIAIGNYNFIGPFSEGLAMVWRDASGDMFDYTFYTTGTRGFINRDGREIIPCVFEDARDFSEGLAAVLIDGKWGYITIEK